MVMCYPKGAGTEQINARNTKLQCVPSMKKWKRLRESQGIMQISIRAITD